MNGLKVHIRTTEDATPLLRELTAALSEYNRVQKSANRQAIRIGDLLESLAEVTPHLVELTSEAVEVAPE